MPKVSNKQKQFLERQKRMQEKKIFTASQGDASEGWNFEAIFIFSTCYHAVISLHKASNK